MPNEDPPPAEFTCLEVSVRSADPALSLDARLDQAEALGRSLFSERRAYLVAVTFADSGHEITVSPTYDGKGVEAWAHYPEGVPHQAAG